MKMICKNQLHLLHRAHKTQHVGVSQTLFPPAQRVDLHLCTYTCCSMTSLTHVKPAAPARQHVLANMTFCSSANGGEHKYETTSCLDDMNN